MTEILLGIIVVLVSVIVVLLCKKPKIETISDNQPNTRLRKDAWLKLQNEGAKYIKYKDGKIYLKIVK